MSTDPPADASAGDVPPPAPAPEPPAPLPSPFARLRLRGLVALMLVTAVALYGALFAIRRHHPGPVERALMPAAVALGYALPLAWTAWRFRALGIAWRRLVGPAPSADSLARVLPLTFVQLLFSSTSLLAGLALLAWLAPEGARAILAHPERFSGGMDRMPPLALTAGLVLVAPVAEELLFRGLLLHRLAARWGARRGLVATSLLFGVLHFNVPAMFAFGLLLGVIYLRTRSLAASMLVHALNNLVPTLMALAARAGPGGVAREAMDPARLVQAGVSMAVMALLSGAALVLYIARHWPAREATMPYDANGPAVPDGMDGPAAAPDAPGPSGGA